MERIVRIIANHLDTQSEDIKPNSELRDLTEDSLDLIEIFMTLEDEFKIDIPDEDLNSLITIQDIADYMEKYSKLSDK